MSDRPIDRSQTPPDGPVLFGRPVQWTFGFVSGLLRSAFMTREERRRRMLERWSDQWFRQVRGMIRDGGAGDEQPAPGTHRDVPSLDALRRMLIGRSRGYVVSMLGSPPATSIPATAEIETPQPASKWSAEIWYYPMDRLRREGVAITFENDRVGRVECMRGPK